jgi:hypothetical protein
MGTTSKGVYYYNSLLDWYLYLVDDGLSRENAISLDGGKTFYLLKKTGFGSGGPTLLRESINLYFHVVLSRNRDVLDVEFKVNFTIDGHNLADSRPTFIRCEFHQDIQTIPLPAKWEVIGAYDFNSHVFVVVQDTNAHKPDFFVYHDYKCENLSLAGIIQYGSTSTDIPGIGMFYNNGVCAGVNLRRLDTSMPFIQEFIKSFQPPQ